MDRLSSKVGKREDPCENAVSAVGILIDGRSPRVLARVAETPSAARDGRSHLAGQYIGLPSEAVFPPSRRLLGEADERYDDWDGRISVLGCGCGVVGCWPLQVKIRVKEGLAVWEDFRQPHRSRWSYVALGPFVFDREEYETVLRESSGV